EPFLHQKGRALVVRFNVAGIELEDLRINVDGFISSGRLQRHPFLVQVAEIKVSLLKGGRKFDGLLETGFCTYEIPALCLDDAVKVIEACISWRLFQRPRKKLSGGCSISLLNKLLD